MASLGGDMSLADTFALTKKSMEGSPYKTDRLWDVSVDMLKLRAGCTPK